MNPAGECEGCGREWTERAGGLDEHGHCPDCRKRFPCEIVYLQANDYEMPDRPPAEPMSGVIGKVRQIDVTARREDIPGLLVLVLLLLVVVVMGVNHG